MSWYLMHRGWQEDAVFDDEPYTQREAWEWLISKASYDGKQKYNIKSSVKCLPVGQLSFSYSYMAKAWGWSKSKVKRFVDRIDDAHMIETMMERGQCIITICKYEKFQLKTSGSETMANEIWNAKRDESETNYKEVKEVKEITPIVPYGDYLKIWNEFANVYSGSGVSAVKAMNDSRRKAIKKIHEGVSGKDPENLRKALKAIQNSKHHMGGNDSGWVVNFDFIIREKEFTKWMEAYEGT